MKFYNCCSLVIRPTVSLSEKMEAAWMASFNGFLGGTFVPTNVEEVISDALGCTPECESRPAREIYREFYEVMHLEDADIIFRIQTLVDHLSEITEGAEFEIPEVREAALAVRPQRIKDMTISEMRAVMKAKTAPSQF